MNVDSVMFQGSAHKMSQDYALSGFLMNGDPYLIVCDGCSSSMNTDFGARILAQSAFQSIHNDVHKHGYDNFGLTVINRADAIRKSLNLNMDCLDSTLIVCFKEDDNYKVFMYGDGVIITKRADLIGIEKVEFTSNAPYYLSYLLKPDRLCAYIKAYGKDEDKLYSNFHFVNDACNVTYKDSVISKIERTIPSENLETILISSDGLSSLYCKETENTFNVVDKEAELIAFKDYRGRFLDRRATRYMKELAANQYVYADDVSLACLVL